MDAQGGLVDGKYRIVRQIGGGAFSEVYLVEGPDGRSALKLLKEKGRATDAVAVEDFKREFTILKDLNHPHIARILDFGFDTERDRYYFTSEFVDGSNFFDATENLEPAVVTNLIVQALRALEYLHSFRVYHFDIKATNVLVLEGARPKLKLIDFGLAGVDPRGKLIGTPSYMPPEIINVEPADGRADLYSLGVLWYYALMRKNPFRARTTEDTLENQLHRIPPPPSSVVNALPQWLDTILGRLLEKNRANRFPTAARVIRAINRFVEKPYALETAATLLSYLPEEGRLVGREQVQSELLTEMEHLKGTTQAGTSWLLHGVRGGGRSRWLREAKYTAQLGDVRVTSASGSDAVQAQALLERLSAHLASGEGFEFFLLDDAQALIDEERAWRLLLARLAQTRRPAGGACAMVIVAVRDDEIDADTLGQLGELCSKTFEIGTFTEAELKSYLVSLTGIEEPPSVLLDGIYRRTDGNPMFVTEILRSLILSGALFDEGGRWNESLFEDVGVDFSRIIVPQTIGALLREQAGTLELAERDIVELLAASTEPLTATVLGAGRDPDEVGVALTALTRKGFIERDEGMTYRLHNDLMGQALFEALSREQQQHLHDRLARALRGAGVELTRVAHHQSRGSDPEVAQEASLALGDIYLRRGLGRRAADYLERAERLIPEHDVERRIEAAMKRGEAQLISHRYEAAEHTFEKVDHLFAELPESSRLNPLHVDAHVRLGGTYLKLGDFERALMSFAEAKRTLSLIGGDPVREIVIENFRASALLSQGKAEEASRAFVASKVAFEALPAGRRSAITNNDLGMSLLALGKLDEAEAAFQDDLQFAESLKDNLLIARVRYNFAQLALARGRYDEAIIAFETCAEICKRCNNTELLLRTYNGLGNLYRGQGKLEQSYAAYARGIALHEHLGDPSGGAILKVNLGIIESERGEDDQALDDLVPAVDYLRSVPQKTANDRAALSRGLLEMGDLLQRKGDLDGARRALEEARGVAEEEASAAPQRFWIALTLAEVALGEGGSGHEEEVQELVAEVSNLAETDDEREKSVELSQRIDQSIARTSSPKEAPPPTAAAQGPTSALSGIDEISGRGLQVSGRWPSPETPQLAAVDRYTRLLEINRLINAESDLTYVLNSVLYAAAELAGAARGAVMLITSAGEPTVICQHNMAVEAQEGIISHSLITRTLQEGRVIVTDDALSDERFSGEESVVAHRFKSVLCAPIRARRRVIGILYLDHPARTAAFAHIDLGLLDAFCDQAGLAIENAQLRERALRPDGRTEAKARVEDMHQERERDAMPVHSTYVPTQSFGVIGKSKSMQEILKLLDKIADTDLAVLLFGESGTGKELVARALHENHRRRRSERFVAVNCGAIPGTLMESELFGHKAGAFTGAVRDKKGLFVEADGGTLFLDEVAELDLMLQVKLLRALQEKECTPVGGTHTVRCDVRVVAASNRDVEALMRKERFREDLYYRLCQIRVEIPPLRTRHEDIPLLVEEFIAESRPGESIMVAPSLMGHLLTYPWPGNVRELKNLIEVACALAEGSVIDERAVPDSYEITKQIRGGGEVELSTDSLIESMSGDLWIDEENTYDSETSWKGYERVIIAKAFEANQFQARPAAAELGLSVTTLYKRIAEWDLKNRDNPVYRDPFRYVRGKTLSEYLTLVFTAAYEYSDRRSYIAIANLRVSQGHFYKVMKNRREKE